MRPLSLLVPVLVTLLACSSQQVEKAQTCTDPCCGGNSALLNCGESANVTCTESGDPCTAQAFGCSDGTFFKRPQASLPASCASDAEADGTLGDDTTETAEDGGLDAASDAPNEGSLDAANDGPLDASDQGPDSATDGALDAPIDAP